MPASAVAARPPRRYTGRVPAFSIILATRDRPLLFGEALQSVLAQSFQEIEVIVIDDGSDPRHRPAYEAALAPARERLGERLRLHRLLRRPNGHGQSYSLNVGVSHAAADYVAFLDDDDLWTDSDHLERAHHSIQAVAAPDLYMAHQRAYLLGEALPDELWLAPLTPALAGRPSDSHGSYRVTLDDLVDVPGFAHLNTLIVRRTLWDTAGGMDEAIRWECDRDLFIRLIDAAGTMLYNPAPVSRHNVPDPSKTANMTTALPMLQKRLHQLRVVDKAALFCRDERLRAHGREHRGYVLKKIAVELARHGDWPAAAHYARDALGAGPGLKWLAAALYYGGRGLLARRR